MSDNTNDENMNNGLDEEILPEEISPEDEKNNMSQEEITQDIYEDEQIYDNINDDVADIDYEKNEPTYDETFLSSLLNKISDVIYYVKNSEPKKRARIISLSSLIVLILILIFTDLIPILPNAFNRFYVGNSYVIGETQGGVYDKFGKDVLYAGNGTVMSFGPDMNCNFKIESTIGTPRLETDGENAIVYYKNSPEVIVIKNASNIDKLKLSDTVTGVTINSRGYYGFVTEESGYKSCVNIYNPNETSIYKWHTNNPIIDISVSNNGKNMVAASYTTQDNVMSGKLIFFDMGVESPVKEIVTKSNVISEVKFIRDDVVVAFGDTYTAAYTNKGVMKWRIDYGGRTLKSYDINKKGEIAMIFDRYSSELSESTVELYSNKGRLMGKYESKDNVKYVSANNDCFLLSLDKQTILLDDDADIMKKRESKRDFRRAVLFYNYNFAFSVSDSVAEIMSVNH